MLSRRGFLIGAGGLLTAAFLKDARVIRRNEAPLLAAPPRTAHTLYWEFFDGMDGPQLFLDEEPIANAPEPPTWRVFLTSMVDPRDYSASEIKERLDQLGFDRGQLDEEMDESWWEMHYDRISGPLARAYHLLDKLDLGPDLHRTAVGPCLHFIEGGGNQFDYSLHAHASDMLALSLLQARLIDVNLPIKVERWEG